MGAPEEEYLGDNSLKIYFKQIHDIEPLSEEEEKKLFRKVKGKGKKAEAARLRLIEVNLPLVITLAKKYYYPSLSIEFLNFIEEGNIGLIKAVERYDPDKGFKFSTYASWWIEKHFQEAILQSRSVIQLPEKKLRTLKNIEETASKLLRESGEAPDYKELADKIDISITEVRDTLLSAMKMKYVKSLDFYLDSSESKTLKDIVSDGKEAFEDVIEKISLKEELDTLLGALNPREKQVITLRFGLENNHNHTYKEISGKLGISVSRTRDIQNVAIRKLRRAFGSAIQGEDEVSL